MMADAKQDPRRDADTGLDPRTFSDRVKTAIVGRREPVYQPEAFVEDSGLHLGAGFGSLPAHAGLVYTLPLGHSILNTQATPTGAQPVKLVDMEIPERIPYVGARKSIIVYNNGGQTCFLAGMQETCNVAMGFPLLAAATIVFDKGVTGELWAICATGLTTDIRILMELAPVAVDTNSAAYENWEES